jgi:hypothetical protein
MLLSLCAGVVFGICAARMFGDTAREVEKTRFAQRLKEKDDEIRRLRAWMADNVGKEK